MKGSKGRKIMMILKQKRAGFAHEAAKMVKGFKNAENRWKKGL